MTIQLRNISVRPLIRRSVRYLLVSHGFRIIQAVVVLAALSCILMDIRSAASIFITVTTTVLLTGLNRRVMTAVDRRLFREAYNA